MLLNSSNFQQRQINTRRKQENLQPFLSTRNSPKIAFFKWSHLALRTFCHAPAGICEQPAKSNSSSSGDWLNAWSKSAATSAPWVPSLKHLQCFARGNLFKDVGKATRPRTFYLKPTRLIPNQIWQSFWIQTVSNRDKLNTRRKQEKPMPSTISLCEALSEICLLQVGPIGSMQFLPRCCWDPMTELKIQGDQVAASQSREEIQDTTFSAIFFRKDVDQMFPGGDWKV